MPELLANIAAFFLGDTEIDPDYALAVDFAEFDYGDTVQTPRFAGIVSEVGTSPYDDVTPACYVVSLDGGQADWFTWDQLTFIYANEKTAA